MSVEPSVTLNALRGGVWHFRSGLGKVPSVFLAAAEVGHQTEADQRRRASEREQRCRGNSAPAGADATRSPCCGGDRIAWRRGTGRASRYTQSVSANCSKFHST